MSITHAGEFMRMAYRISRCLKTRTSAVNGIYQRNRPLDKLIHFSDDIKDKIIIIVIQINIIAMKTIMIFRKLFYP